MKFYNCKVLYDEMDVDIIETKEGEWAKREDAEQAAKDAVAMASELQSSLRKHWNPKNGFVEDGELYQEAQAIIDKYEGGQA